MLYATNPGQNFALLTEALRAYGVSEEALDILQEYFDLEKPRNNALLDQIPQKDFSGYRWNYQNREKLEKAVKKEIDRAKSDELYERWYLFVHAIAGAHCRSLNLRGEMKYEEWEKSVLRAFRSRFGDDAEAVQYACDITPYFDGSNFHYYNFSRPKNYSVGLRAIKYINENQYGARLVIGLLALDEFKIPEKKGLLSAIFGNKDQEAQDVQEALALIDEAVQNAAQCPQAIDLLLTALAEASLFSEKYRQLFESKVGSVLVPLASTAMELPLTHPERIIDVLDSLPQCAGTGEYISMLAWSGSSANSAYRTQFRHLRTIPNHGVHLKKMAERFPEVYRQQLEKEEDPEVLLIMEKTLLSVDKSYQPAAGNTPLERTRRRCIKQLASDNPQYYAEIEQYLNGGTMEELLQIMPNLHEKQNYWRIEAIDYISSFGLDEFAERCICLWAMVNSKTDNMRFVLRRLPGIEFLKNEKTIIGILRKHGVPLPYILNICTSGALSYYQEEEKKQARETVITCCQDFAEELAGLDTKQLTADARCFYVLILGKSGKYAARLAQMTDDGSKVVRAVLCEYLPHDEELIRSLLTAKKGAKREIAVTLLEKQFPESLRPDVEAAFAAEKTNAVKKRLADLLGAALPEEVQSAVTGDVVAEMTKGNKAKKVAWLYENPFTPVKKSDGSEAEDAYLQAMLLCYANANPPGRSTAADGLASGLNADDLEHFAAEVFARWVNGGAPAKTKWVLYFTAVHGGLPMVEALQRYIKEWAEHSRGAIAAEAVSALAMNGSSIALIAVDNMARKFKNKQVRSAAGAALERAAEALNLTREELADQIVPDLGFDEQLCRTFDFGARQFRVYLTPALELEIFEGEKRLKNLPKPGVKDDPEISAAAVKDFKEMKKQMKAAIQSQRQRLEYVLLCDRKWTADGWRDLFIRKAVMHSFAIGLIWGVYENGKLVQSFRYMEDGSFNTPDEEEYTLPEGAEVAIGLVHPMELDEETLAAWREQLADYEIKQPFLQIDRPVYRLTDAEKKQKALLRFEDMEISNMTLLSRMTKFGWDKGTPQDAGMFYEFIRTDIMRQEKTENGSKKVGFCTELKFSGMYAGGFDYSGAEDVTIGKVEICLPGKDNGWEDTNPDALAMWEVSERYISEIIYQLTEALASAAKEESEE